MARKLLTDRFNKIVDTHEFIPNKKSNIAIARNSKTLLHGEVECRTNLGELVFKKSNIIVVGGRRFTLEKLFNIGPETTNRITVNNLLGINETEPAYTGVGPRKEKSICLFGVGRGGSGLELGSVINPSGREYDVYDRVPFRYVLQSNDLSSVEQEKYAMKTTEGNYFAYYMKQFELTPTLNMMVDGEQYVISIDDNIRLDVNGQYINRPDVEVWIELLLKIDTVDIREFFIATETIDSARINELALYFGYKEDLQVWSDYYAVECFSKLTFDNEALSNQTKILDIVYRIYI